MQRLNENYGVILIMGMLSDLLKKAPQSVKDKYKIKIREKAIERVKEKIIKHNKKVEDDSDDEMEAKGYGDNISVEILSAEFKYFLTNEAYQ